MSMKFFASHDQFVADLPSDDQQDHLRVVPIDIIQHPKVLNTQFKLRQRIWPQATDRLRRDWRLVTQSSGDCRFNDALFTSQECLQLCVRFVGNRNMKRHLQGRSQKPTTESNNEKSNSPFPTTEAMGHRQPSPPACLLLFLAWPACEMEVPM